MLRQNYTDVARFDFDRDLPGEEIAAGCGRLNHHARGWFILIWQNGLLLLMAATAVTYSLQSFKRYSRFQSAGYDLGIFDQAVRQYSLFSTPYSQIKGPGVNVLGDHFHPIIALISPLYWLWDDPRMLGIVMAVAVASSVLPVFLFVERRLGRTSAWLVSSSYAFWWPLQGLVASDFHEISLGVPLIGWIIHALDQGKVRSVTVLCLALLGVREDMGLVVTVVGVLVVLQHRRHRHLGILLAGTGLAAYFVITGILIPHVNEHGTFGYWKYSGLGSTMGEAAGFVLSHPLETIRLLFDNQTKQTLWLCLLLPLGLMPLGSSYSLMAFPLLAGRLLSDRPGTWGTAFQYNAILAPILVMAAVEVYARLISGRRPKRCFRLLGPILMAVSTATGSLFIPGLFPLQGLFEASAWTPSVHNQAQARIVGMVPNGVLVEADDRLVPHLTRRTTVGMIGRQSETASWAIVDLNQPDTGGGGDGNFDPTEALAFLKSKGFLEVTRDDNVVLLRKPNPTQPIRYLKPR